MANNKLFKDLNLNNKVSRNGFDLSHNVKFTAKCGELLPLFHKTVMPGDELRISLNSFTRTAPVETAAFTQIREYYDFFFVPYRLLWKNAPNVLMQNTKNPSIADSPTGNVSVGSKLPWMPLNQIYKAVSDNATDGLGITTILGKLTNQFGFNRGQLSRKLLNHLGYGYVSTSDYRDWYYSETATAVSNAGENTFEVNPEVCLFPLMAYNKIYYDFFRNTTWEDNQPYNYNVDYLSSEAYVPIFGLGEDHAYYDSPTMFDLRYSIYPKDLFFGLLPNAQYGDESVVDVDLERDPSALNEANVRMYLGDMPPAFVDSSGSVGSEGYPNVTPPQASTPLVLDVDNLLNKLNSSFSIIALRKANFLQRYKEIIGSGAVDYQNLVRKIFNVEVSDTLADHCIYLGGQTSTITINEVVNQNLSGDGQADVKGKGSGSANSQVISFGNSEEFGIIMCIYHAQPVIDYSLEALNYDVTKTEVDDYANPVFDKLGFQGFPFYYMWNRRYSLDHPTTEFDRLEHPFIGYTSRYFDYKSEIDKVLGDFKETRANWVSPVNFAYLYDYVSSTGARIQLNSSFFHVNPHIVDPVFTLKCNDYPATDQLLVSVNFEIHAVRNLDYLGVPY